MNKPVDALFRKLRPKAYFRSRSNELRSLEVQFSDMASRFLSLYRDAPESEQHLYCAYFVQVAGFVRLIREDLDVIFDRFYSPTPRAVELRIDLARARNELEIHEYVLSRSDFPKSFLERATQVREVFRSTIGSAVDSALERQAEELASLMK